MSSLINKRIALVYDRINKWGGAERVLLALHELFPQAPLYTAVYDPRTTAWANVFEINTSFLQKIPFASRHHELLPFLMPTAFESFKFDNFDLVISITSEAAKGIITKPQTKHICYCLTPTRYLWSGFEEYFPNPAVKLISKPIIQYLRKWDIQAAQRPDVFFAISKEVKDRIKKYYGRESEVIYPPVTLGDSVKRKRLKENPGISSPFFLVVSRLVSYKRVDLAIQACNELGLPLKIIGTGSDEKRLRSMAGSTVSFDGFVTDEELAEYYSSCTALIFPGNEDFGLAMVEAQSFGKPVIAYKAGGALEIVNENKTGILFSPQTKEGLKAVLQQFDVRVFSSGDCRKQAEKFSQERFSKQFLKMLAEVV